MLRLMQVFFQTKKGSLVENIIYIIIIGALSFTFYADKFKEPMVTQMDGLNVKIQEWTNTSGVGDDNADN